MSDRDGIEIYRTRGEWQIGYRVGSPAHQAYIKAQKSRGARQPVRTRKPAARPARGRTAAALIGFGLRVLSQAVVEA